jgi:A/G-specific adenine glycosylase
VDVTVALVAWFRRTARALPWRTEPRDPYRSLVSEVMLQQTQVERVAPRFEAFVARFPTLGDLARADEDEVLAAWSGLGYYRRARLLHRLAKAVLREHGGVLPVDPDVLVSLPGVGEYTAAAIASMVHGHRVPVVDGNVRRVAARVLGFSGEPRSARATRRFGSWVDGLMEDALPGVVNEALMELGASLCTPRAPRCPECPLAPACVARAEGRTAEIPAPRRTRPVMHLRWVAACCIRPDGRWLLRQVSSGPILRGLWLPPTAELAARASARSAALALIPRADLTPGPVLAPVCHSITHRRIEVVPVRLDAATGSRVAAPWRWVDPEAPDVPTSTLLRKLWNAVVA